jgi:hypothetical protein
MNNYFSKRKNTISFLRFVNGAINKLLGIKFRNKENLFNNNITHLNN